MPQLPALALAAAAGRRTRTVELAREIEERGFSGIYCASFGDSLGLCVSIAHATSTIRFGTAIANIYTRHPFEMAQAGSYIHELSDGRFWLGIGVSHGRTNDRLGVDTGKPLSDIRNYVQEMRAVEQQVGPLPPIVLATLRRRMTALAGEIAQGAVWANASRSHLPASLGEIDAEQCASDGFFIGDMLPTCIDDDEEAAAAVMRRTLTSYLMLPNYRNYWKEAGYVEEMAAVEDALAARDTERLPSLMSDRWLNDCTLHGPRRKVMDGLEAWYAAGMKTPILVASSTKGGQLKAFEEIFEAFAGT
jgi:alkanesulfonate monooxygenase SsuD/methylene tetrahydromethanopterin reductase-like flavin-dependent oxidoreductase (luciferase family)